MEQPVGKPTKYWRSYGLPVLVTVGVFAGMNGLWNNPESPLFLVYLASSLVALGAMGFALRAGSVSQRDLGLAITGWTAPKRLLGLTVTLLLVYGAYIGIQPTLKLGPTEQETEKADSQTEASQTNAAAIEAKKPSWGGYCFWFIFLLPASFTELLVFVGVGFCLSEAGLRQRGVRPLTATALAAILAAVSFGLFHFTYPDYWWGMVIVPLMPSMLINICLFVVTRNFYLMLLLHNAFAAVGFIGVQFSQYPPNPKLQPEYFQRPIVMAPVLLAFLIPFLLLHWLEAKGSRLGQAAALDKSEDGTTA